MDNEEPDAEYSKGRGDGRGFSFGNGEGYGGGFGNGEGHPNSTGCDD